MSKELHFFGSSSLGISADEWMEEYFETHPNIVGISAKLDEFLEDGTPFITVKFLEKTNA